MFYYRYDERYIIVEKSEEALTGDNVVHYQEDLDITLYNIVVGHIGDDGTMRMHTKMIKSVELVAQKLNMLMEENSSITEHQAEVEVDLDFRLSMLELGLV